MAVCARISCQTCTIIHECHCDWGTDALVIGCVQKKTFYPHAGVVPFRRGQRGKKRETPQERTPTAIRE